MSSFTGSVHKAEALMKKDLSSKYAGCTFYQLHDYSKPFTQKEWKSLWELFQKVTADVDKSTEDYGKLVSPFINAIVVGSDGYYVRKGMQSMEHSGEKFIRGVNDKISQGYFVEPYKYVKDEAAATKYEQEKAKYEEETKDLRAAQQAYHAALRRYNEKKGTKSESYYEAQMQEAHARMLSAQIQYDNRKK